MRVRVGRARCEGGCRRVLGAGAGLAHWGRREGDGWMDQGIARVAVTAAIAIIVAFASIDAAVALAPQQAEKRQCSVCRAGESWCGEAAQLPVDKGGVVVRVRCYAMAAKQACLPNALALPGRAVRVLCGPRCFRCVLTKTSQCRPPIQLWPAKPLVSRPRLQMPKSLHHQHPFSQQHPFCTRFPALFRPSTALPALFLHFWRHLRIPFLSSSPSPRPLSTPIPY